MLAAARAKSVGFCFLTLVSWSNMTFRPRSGLAHQRAEGHPGDDPRGSTYFNMVPTSMVAGHFSARILCKLTQRLKSNWTNGYQGVLTGERDTDTADTLCWHMLTHYAHPCTMAPVKDLVSSLQKWQSCEQAAKEAWPEHPQLAACCKVQQDQWTASCELSEQNRHTSSCGQASFWNKNNLHRSI